MFDVLFDNIFLYSFRCFTTFITIFNMKINVTSYTNEFSYKDKSSFFVSSTMEYFLDSHYNQIYLYFSKVLIHIFSFDFVSSTVSFFYNIFALLPYFGLI